MSTTYQIYRTQTWDGGIYETPRPAGRFYAGLDVLFSSSWFVEQGQRDGAIAVPCQGGTPVVGAECYRAPQGRRELDQHGREALQVTLGSAIGPGCFDQQPNRKEISIRC